MDAISDPLYGKVVVQKSAQVGWTEILLNACGYYADHDPCPILVVQPTIQMAQAWSKDRLAPMLRDTPVLKDKVKPPRSRDSENTVLHKKFPGGHLTAVGANAPASLASRPIKVTALDEVDRFPLSAGPEGNVIILVGKRQVTFHDRKMILGSTPTVKGASNIEHEFEQSDKRYYFVPCPHCGEMQVLKWSNVQWDSGRPETAHYVCDVHGCVIEHIEKYDMLLAGEWRTTAESSGIAGFFINEIYSPWVTWEEMARNFLAAKDDTESLKAFVNTSLGETWEEQGEEVDHIGLYARRERYTAQVPTDALVLTCAVDVQDDRLEYEVKGWGVAEENWGIEKGVLYGDPAQATVWDELDDHLQRTFEHESGATLHIECTLIDSGGHHTQAVYDFCRTREHRRVYAIKGAGGAGIPVFSYSAKAKAKNKKRKVGLYMIGVDGCKKIVASRFKKAEPGPGYCHFPDTYDEEYFLQCAAEKCVTKHRRGFAYQEWIKTRPRNEGFDLNVYNFAAIKILNPAFERIEKRLNGKEKEEKPEEKQQKRPAIQRPRAKRNWVTGWKL